MLAGYNPATVELRLVVDMAWALLIEIYRDYGLKFEEAMAELNKSIMGPQAPETKKATEQSDANSMAMLQAMMGGSDFKGPRG